MPTDESYGWDPPVPDPPLPTVIIGDDFYQRTVISGASGTDGPFDNRDFGVEDDEATYLGAPTTSGIIATKWYEWVAPSSGTFLFSLAGTGLVPTVDYGWSSSVQVYRLTDTDGDVWFDNFTLVADGTDANVDPAQSTLGGFGACSAKVVSGTTYYIRVGGYDEVINGDTPAGDPSYDPAGGWASLTEQGELEWSGPATAADFSSPITISGASGTDTVDYGESTLDPGDTLPPTPPREYGYVATGPRWAWYEWTAPSDGIFSFQLGADPLSSIRVYWVSDGVLLELTFDELGRPVPHVDGVGNYTIFHAFSGHVYKIWTSPNVIAGHPLPPESEVALVWANVSSTPGSLVGMSFDPDPDGLNGTPWIGATPLSEFAPFIDSRGEATAIQVVLNSSFALDGSEVANITSPTGWTGAYHATFTLTDAASPYRIQIDWEADFDSSVELLSFFGDGWGGFSNYEAYAVTAAGVGSIQATLFSGQVFMIRLSNRNTDYGKATIHVRSAAIMRTDISQRSTIRSNSLAGVDIPQRSTIEGELFSLTYMPSAVSTLNPDYGVQQTQDIDGVLDLGPAIVPPPTPTLPLAQPTAAPTVVAVGAGSAIPPGTYSYRYAWYRDTIDTVTAMSPATQVTTVIPLSGYTVTTPALPSGATGVIIYVQTVGDEDAWYYTDSFPSGGANVDTQADKDNYIWGNTWDTTIIETLPISPITHVYEVYAPPGEVTVERATPDPDLWQPVVTVDDDYGALVIRVGGKDVTYFRNKPTQLGSYGSSEPFGDEWCELFFPQIGVFERPSHGTLDWIWFGAPVDILIDRGVNGLHYLFTGFMATNGLQAGPGGVGVSLKCMGTLYQADLAVQIPFFTDERRDAGRIIRKRLKDVIGRLYNIPAEVETGIVIRERGAYSNNLLTSGVQDILSRMTDNKNPSSDDGLSQWTVALEYPRRPVIRRKDVDTVNWTVTLGGRGVDTNLDNDMTMIPNTIYGEGTTPDGRFWRNTKYPNLQGDAPDFPLSPGQEFRPGSNTSGFRDFSERMTDLGYDMKSGNKYSSKDYRHVIDIQKKRGLTVSGDVGAQTWQAVFDPSVYNNSALQAYILPIAVNPVNEPYLRSATGAVKGPNPNYRRERLRVERLETYGNSISKNSAIDSAELQIRSNRFWEPNYVGTITLNIDPREGSRYLIKAGQNIMLEFAQAPLKNSTVFGFKDNGYTKYDGLLLHISSVSVDWRAGTVNLSVSNRATDAMTLAQIIERNRLNADPGRIPGYNHRQSKITTDRKVIWDSESGAGRIPKFAHAGDVWQVFAIPAAQAETIVSSSFKTTSSPTTYAIAVFRKSIKPSQLASLVGNPLTQEDPFTRRSDDLDSYGLIMAWGMEGARCGYYPLKEGDDDATVTGRFVDDAAWELASDNPPWIWIAVYANAPCYFSGLLKAAPVQ